MRTAGSIEKEACSRAKNELIFEKMQYLNETYMLKPSGAGGKSLVAGAEIGGKSGLWERANAVTV